MATVSDSGVKETAKEACVLSGLVTAVLFMSARHPEVTFFDLVQDWAWLYGLVFMVALLALFARYQRQ